MDGLAGRDELLDGLDALDGVLEVPVEVLEVFETLVPEPGAEPAVELSEAELPELELFDSLDVELPDAAWEVDFSAAARESVR